MSPRVLITHGCGLSSYVAAKSLHRAGFEVYSCDASPLNMTRSSRAVRGFDATPDPFKEPSRYVDKLAQIITRRKIDLLLPGHDDVFCIQAYTSVLPAAVIVAAPPFGELSIADDKFEIIRIAEGAGVMTPKTFAIGDVGELEQVAQSLGFPLIVKTRRGGGGTGVHIISSMDKLLAYYQRQAADGRPPEGWPIVQEYIAGGELFGVCFLAKEGRLKACFLEHYLRCEAHNFGTSVLRERCDWQLPADAAAKLVAALCWTGIGHLDFIANPAMTEVYLLEMNPRWWGALNLAVINGFDFPLGLATMALDGEPAAAAFREVYPPCKSLWIWGEMRACRWEMKHGNFSASLSSLARIVSPGRDCGYDDFDWRDPLPLTAEFAYHLGDFLRRSAWRAGDRSGIRLPFAPG